MRGFSALERMEQVSVGLELAIIAGLLFGLAVHFGEVTSQNARSLMPLRSPIGRALPLWRV